MAKLRRLTQKVQLSPHTRCIAGEVLSRGKHRWLVRYRPGCDSYIALKDGEPREIVHVQFVEDGHAAKVRVGGSRVPVAVMLYPDRNTGRFVQDCRSVRDSAFCVETTGRGPAGSLVPAVFVKPIFVKPTAEDHRL